MGFFIKSTLAQHATTKTRKIINSLHGISTKCSFDSCYCSNHDDWVKILVFHFKFSFSRDFCKELLMSCRFSMDRVDDTIFDKFQWSSTTVEGTSRWRWAHQHKCGQHELRCSLNEVEGRSFLAKEYKFRWDIFERIICIKYCRTK